MSRVLIDTNIISAYFRGEPSVVSSFEGAEKLYLPVIVLGELCYGAHHSAAVEKHLFRITQLLQVMEIVEVDAETAMLYGKLREDMGRGGDILPQNDWWIAALAVQHGLPLVTRDAHFSKVPGLAVQSWEAQPPS